MYDKRKCAYPTEYDEHINKIVPAHASQFVVSIVSHNVPAELCKTDTFFGCGIILEGHIPDNDVTYLSTIVAPASLFKDIPQDKIDIDVYAPTGVLYKAQLLDSDFHYNLALITINSTSKLPSAVLTPIDDVSYIDPTHQPKKMRNKSLLFKVAPDTHILSVSRSHIQPLVLRPASGILCLATPKNFSCNELYKLTDTHFLGRDGAPVLNSYGQIIGIVFNNNFFLPSNVVLRWWNHYKSSGRFCRPFIGLEVVNLHERDFKFLAPLTTRGIFTAVVVTKVVEGSPACRSGVRTNDVILKLDGKVVLSKLEFCETIWEKVGTSVEVRILRDPNGEELDLSLSIEEASPDKFHRWPRPRWD